MTVSKKQENDKLYIALEGRLDTMTSPEFEAELDQSLDGITELTLDFSALDYISSAGLRVLLRTHKRLTGQGEMKITGANETINEIFDVTGFNDILNIE